MHPTSFVPFLTALFLLTTQYSALSIRTTEYPTRNGAHGRAHLFGQERRQALVNALSPVKELDEELQNLLAKKNIYDQGYSSPVNRTHSEGEMRGMGEAREAERNFELVESFPSETAIIHDLLFQLNFYELPDTYWDLTDICTTLKSFVYCDAQGFVTTIDLTDTEATGIIPRSITRLSRLQKLFLGYNYFSVIPNYVFDIPSLASLDISQNNVVRFSGNVKTGYKPKSFNTMKILDLSGNNFEGPLPTFLTAFPNLIYLNASSNFFAGVVPPQLFLMPKLRYLDLDFNLFNTTAAPPNKPSVSLTFLDLSQNEISGLIPRFLNNLTNLVSLNLAHNYLYGDARPWLFMHPSLRALDLSSNYLDYIPPSVMKPSPVLSFLDLSNNQIVSQLPSLPFQLPSLTYLNLSYIGFYGKYPSSLPLTLSILDLSNNQLTGAIPWLQLAKLKSLKILILDQNQFEGTLPYQFPPFNSLQMLSACGNFLTGLIPPSIKVLKKLQQLVLCQNNFFGPVPTTLPSLPNLAVLDLSMNQFSGPLPTNFVSANIVNPKLGAYAMNNNFFSGPVIVATQNKNPLCVENLDPSYSSDVSSVRSNCLYYPSNYPCALREDMRSDSSCNAFCGLSGSTAPCGGHGYCSLDPFTLAPSCLCFKYWVSGPKPGTCVPKGSYTPPPVKPPNIKISTGLLPAPPPSSSFPHLSPLSSRYLSVGYLPSSNGSTWNVFLDWNWAYDKRTFVSSPVQSQGNCPTCWAFAAVSVVESAFAIAYGNTSLLSSAPLLSVQQVLDCVYPSSASLACSPSFPQVALDYASKNALSLASKYPYKGTAGNRDVCNTALVNQASFYQISYFERVYFFSWFGFLLSVQSQPIIVSVRGSYPTFQSYPYLASSQNSQPYVYQDGNCFLDSFVDHVVVLVGYNLTADVAYWVVRNSWGPQWGDEGYMTMAIRGGDGICGVNTAPGYYPVVKVPNDPCLLSSYHSGYGSGGVMNPCGNGTCVPLSSSSYNCQCSEQFVSVNSPIDGLPTCQPVDVCGFSFSSPCGVGSCVNDLAGSYSCICPLGYQQGKAPDGTITCIIALSLPSQIFITGPPGLLSCDAIYPIYGLNKIQFLVQNPTVQCFVPSTFVGKTLNVTPPPGYKRCAVPFVVSEYITCADLSSSFDLFLSNFTAMNPGLNCKYRIRPNTAVCLQLATVPSDLSPPVCTQFYSVQPGDTCSSIMDAQFPSLSPLEFFRMNPGINCGRISPPVQSIGNNDDGVVGGEGGDIPGVQVCVSSRPMGGINCKNGSFRPKVSFCAALFVPGSPFREYATYQDMVACNGGKFICSTSQLNAGVLLCKSKRPKLKCSSGPSPY